MNVLDYAVDTQAGASNTYGLDYTISRATPFLNFGPYNSVAASVTFAMAFNHIKSHFKSLLAQAEEVAENLDRLEARIKALRGFVAREDALISSAEAELLSQLQTRLGWNQKKLRTLRSIRSLLMKIRRYGNHVHAHIATAQHVLHACIAEIESFRDRIIALETASGIPIGLQVKGVRVGLARMQGWTDGAVQGRRSIVYADFADWSSLVED
jgi:hypothetical protein